MPDETTDTRLLPVAHRWRSWFDTAVTVVAVFGLLNVATGIVTPLRDANWIWIQGAGVSPLLLHVLLVLFGLAMLTRSLVPPWGRRLARGLCALVALCCSADAVRFAGLWASHVVAAPTPLSLSLILAVFLGLWAWTGPSRASVNPCRASSWWFRVAGVGAVAVLGTWTHIATFGATDYRRSADVAVVLGCAVRADGSPSPALRDRTRTACRLYRDGLVSRLVLSGGRNPAVPISEPRCMRRIALEEGVPATALILDETGITTAATMRATRDLSLRHGWRRVLVVSHDYHLARIRLSAHHLGVSVRTVPAEETVAWPGKVLVVAREVVAFGWYFLRG